MCVHVRLSVCLSVYKLYVWRSVSMFVRLFVLNLKPDLEMVPYRSVFFEHWIHKYQRLRKRVVDIYIYLKLWKPGLANLTFCVTFHNFSCLILACVLCFLRLISVFFFSAFWLGICCVEVDVDIINLPPRLPHPVPPLCFCPYPQFSL